MKDNNNGTDTLDVLVANIQSRLAALRLERERLVDALLPIDAGIAELTQLLSSVDGTDTSWGQSMISSSQGVVQPVVQPVVAAKVEKSPVHGTRTGPAESPPGADAVLSPKSRTPIMTNVAVLKSALGRA